jgi:alpha-L-rhamnosidase
MRAGEKEKLEQNIRGYFDYMALRTGTLWENDTPHASCNHGFASHVLVWLDYLGYLD